MTLRSNYHIIYYRMATYSIIFVFIAILYTGAVLFSHERVSIVFPVFFAVLYWLLSGADLLWHWIVFGREIQLTEEGITIKFLGFTRFYQWNKCSF